MSAGLVSSTARKMSCLKPKLVYLFSVPYFSFYALVVQPYMLNYYYYYFFKCADSQKPCKNTLWFDPPAKIDLQSFHFFTWSVNREASLNLAESD